MTAPDLRLLVLYPGGVRTAKFLLRNGVFSPLAGKTLPECYLSDNKHSLHCFQILYQAQTPTRQADPAYREELSRTRRCQRLMFCFRRCLMAARLWPIPKAHAKAFQTRKIFPTPRASIFCGAVSNSNSSDQHTHSTRFRASHFQGSVGRPLPVVVPCYERSMNRPERGGRSRGYYRLTRCRSLDRHLPDTPCPVIH